MLTSTRESRRLPNSLNPLVPAYALLTLALGMVLLNIYESDVNFVLYRFAARLASGSGLRYGLVGQEVSTYPLLPATLAMLSLWLDVSLIGWILVVVSVSLGAYCLSRLAGSGNHPILCGALYIATMMFQPSPVGAVTTGLGLAIIALARSKRWMLAGILIGLAVLTHPAVIPLTILLVIWIVSESRWNLLVRFLIPAALLPGLILILVAQPGNLSLIAIDSGFWSAGLLLMALAGFLQKSSSDALEQKKTDKLLIAWTAITIGVALITVTPLSAVAVPGLILLALRIPGKFVTVMAILAVTVDIFLRIGFAPKGAFVNLDSPTPGAVVGQWLEPQVKTGVTVATDQIGALAYYARAANLIDLSGKLARAPIDTFFIARYAPDILVLPDGMIIPWDGFATTYANVFREENLTAYVRVVNFSGLDDHPVDVNFSDRLGRQDVRLAGIGLANSLRPGDLVRVRLDWDIAYTGSFPLEIKLDLLPESGSGASTLDRIPAEVFHQGRVSTYHVMKLPDDAPDGKIRLFANVGARAGIYGIHQLAAVEVKRIS